MAAKKKASKKPAKKKSARKPSAAFMKPVQIPGRHSRRDRRGRYPRTEVTKKSVGLHQEAWPAGFEEPPQHQCGRQAESSTASTRLRSSCSSSSDASRPFRESPRSSRSRSTRIEALIKLTREPVSLDAEVSEDSDSTVMDFVENPDAVMPSDPHTTVPHGAAHGRGHH